jgi:signal transduction histidine kinase
VFVIKPFQVGNSDQRLAVLIGVSEANIFKEVRDTTRHIIILAALALALSAIIVYFVLNKITKPTIKMTKIMKVIPLREQDGKKSGTISRTA